MEPETKVWTLFSLKYVIPKSLKFSHWPSRLPFTNVHPQKPQRGKPSSKRRWLHVLAAKPQLLHDMEAEKESAIQGFPAKLLDPEIQEISREYSMLDTLQGTNISQPGEKENHLRKCLGRESVSSREGITNNGSGNRVFFWQAIVQKWSVTSRWGPSPISQVKKSESEGTDRCGFSGQNYQKDPFEKH